MSFLRKGRKARRVFVTVMALAAFQVLAVIGAGSAFAVTDCTFSAGSGAIECTIDPGDTLELAVEGDSDLDPLAPPGSILQNVNGGGHEAIGSATNANTTSIEVLGSNGDDEFFWINNNVSAGTPPLSGEFNPAITWAVDLGTNTAAGDDLQISTGEGDDTVVLTDSSFTLNGGGGPVLGNENYIVDGWGGDDLIDGSALVNVTGSTLFGDAGDDKVLPGASGVAPSLPDSSAGGAGTDTLSYEGRTTSTVIDNAAGLAGFDANGDGDLADAGDEPDTHSAFEILQTGSGNDTLIGSGGVTETFLPGDGDDSVTGNAGNGDVLDYSSSSAGMVIDTTLGSATGQGTDTFTDVFDFVGSAFDDVLVVDDDAPGPDVSTFSGGDGTDTVDGTTSTGGILVDLDSLDPEPDDLENALGGSGNDDLNGNDGRNRLEGNDGDDDLDGDEGNDTMIGGLGNDDFTGDEGADKVSFETNATNGVNVDVNLGFATSAESGDDSFGDTIEIITGSPFRDTITGGGGVTSMNFLFSGGNGKDTLTGSGSNDTLRGGKGNDRLRGLEGGDTLKGGPGKRDRGFGGPGQDFCSGVEIERSC